MSLYTDLLALVVLLLILFFLRSRHPGRGMHLWFAGMLLLLGEAVAHVAYLVPGPWHRASHIAALDCYALAGAVFVYASARSSVRSGRHLGIVVAINSVARLVALTLYGLDVRSVHAFYVAAGVGFVLSIASSFFLQRISRGLFILSYVGLWTVFAIAASRGSFRFAVYWLLCCLFFHAAIGFARTMPSHSIGKYTVVSGFAVWALLFLVHPSVAARPVIGDLVDSLWNLQKFQIAVGMLIVMLESQVERTHELALQDPLTGLPNRRLFDDRLSQAMLQAARMHSRVGFFMLDLNGFKEVNDRFGHEAGDEVLCQVSRNLRSAIRSSDTLARIGGDEFAIIVSGFTTAQPLAAELLRAIETPVVHAGRRFTISSSIGLAVFPDDTRDPGRLRHIADERMYTNKRDTEFPTGKLKAQTVTLPRVPEPETLA